MNEDLLYLIPFYDLYEMKKMFEERYKSKCDKLKKNTYEQYNDTLK
jgi:hypothetical protein